ncbi:MAG: hypothetical protein Q9227_008463 [Pyrenula ochraceoflavens]
MALSGKQSSLRRPWMVISGSVFLLVLVIVALTAKAPSFRSQRIEIPSLTTNWGPLPPANSPSEPFAEPEQFVKPPGVKIIGLVFFGRKSRVEILRCYLEKRNMVDRGGWLDEIHWVQNTDKKKDLAYLDEILASSPRYKKIDLSKQGVGFVGYAFAWGHLERGNYYIKIDDDVVYMADDTIPRIVSLKLSNPEKYFLVSANIVNNPLLGWVHLHMGAQHPYLPEYIEDPASSPSDTLSSLTSHLLPTPLPAWRPSAHPNWTGPPEFYAPLDLEPPSEDAGTPPHRWLRLPSDSDLPRTPISQTTYETWGPALKSWPIAAQTHYSFLENLSLDPFLSVYKFPNQHVWLTDYDRLSINFMVVYADDVLDNLPFESVDEESLTKLIPQRLGRSVAVEMGALAVHFSFATQAKGLAGTDLLGRYRAVAEEGVCGM